MATTKKSSARTTNKAKQSKGRGAASLDRLNLDRLNESLDAAQKALSDLQGDLGRGARDVAKNVSRLIRDARKDTAKLNKALVKDLGQLGQALTPGGNGATRANKKAPAKRTATKRTGTKRAPARKT
jgi:hypothetical protein